MKIQRYLQASPLFLLARAYERTVEDFQKKLKPHGLNLTQAWIAVALFFEQEPVRPGRLAETLQTTASNISHALKGLVAGGWVARSSSAEDARSFHLELTPAGRKKVVVLIKMFNELQDVFESELGERRIVAWGRRTRELEGIYSRRLDV